MIIYIVGDRFEGFSKNSQVTTVAQFCKLAETVGFLPGTKAIIGQGVSRTNVMRLRQHVTAVGQESSVDFVDFSAPKADRNLCNKHRPENSLLSIPRKVAENVYEMQLLIDDGCAEMSDHVTGQHVQGMVLVEAARQSFLAVTEAYYADTNCAGRYFVINSMNVEYMNFAFPLPTVVRYEVLDLTHKKHGTIVSESAISFLQCGSEICRVRVGFAVYGTDYLSQREAAVADRTFRNYLASDGLLVAAGPQQIPLRAMT